MTEPGRHERYDIPHADILDEDVWADDAARACESCGATLQVGDRRCSECGVLIPICVGTCGACVSPRCVGDAPD